MPPIRRVSVVLLLALTGGCDEVPDHTHFAPKTVVVDKQEYLACEGYIRIYHPPRDVASSSSSHYEIVFTDDYGQPMDLKDVASYTVKDAPKDASYAMAGVANSLNLSTTYSNGQPLVPGSVVYFGKDGSDGRARWNGKGQWAPVLCKGPF
jgi:hypothetical protein